MQISGMLLLHACRFNRLRVVMCDELSWIWMDNTYITRYFPLCFCNTSSSLSHSKKLPKLVCLFWLLSKFPYESVMLVSLGHTELSNISFHPRPCYSPCSENSEIPIQRSYKIPAYTLCIAITLLYPSIQNAPSEHTCLFCPRSKTRYNSIMFRSSSVGIRTVWRTHVRCLFLTVPILN